MITVIIPTYNHGRYLKKAIAAITDQDNLVTRIVVVNDGSTDDTCIILEELRKKDERLIIVDNGKNEGALHACKVGLEYVNTEFFTFAAADDFLLPKWAICSIKAIRDFPAAALCVSNTFIKDVEGNSFSKTVIPKAVIGRYLDPIAFEETLWKFGVWFSSNTVLFRTSKFDINFLINDAVSMSDMLLICGLGLKYGIVATEEYLGCFHSRAGSLSNSVARNNTAFGLLSVLAHQLYESDISIYFNRRIAKKIYLRYYYICLFEQLNYILEVYRARLGDIPKDLGTRLISISLVLMFYLLKSILVLLIKPNDIFRWIASCNQRVSASDINLISTYEVYADDYWDNLSNICTSHAKTGTEDQTVFSDAKSKIQDKV